MEMYYLGLFCGVVAGLLIGYGYGFKRALKKYDRNI